MYSEKRTQELLTEIFNGLRDIIEDPRPRGNIGITQRTPQEIADFFNCYIAMERCGDWYMYEDKPEIVDGYWNSSDISPYRLREGFLKDIEDHDWTILIEPSN